LVEDTADNLKAAEIFKVSLGKCGIRMSIKAVPSEIYWDASNVDSVFQGHYDMTQLSWADPITNPCPLFSSQNIPATTNNYLGMNFSGYSNQEFDTNCNILATTNLSGARNDLLKKMEAQITEEMPAIPLYSYSKLIIAQKYLCAVGLDSQNKNELANIENYLISSKCPSIN
jgi:ABC-type transport system substrate-binding protein